MMTATATADDGIFNTMGFLRRRGPAGAWRPSRLIPAPGKEQRT